MRKVVKKDAPKQRNEQSKDHWSDRHKVLITVLAIVAFVGSIVFLWIMGPSIR